METTLTDAPPIVEKQLNPFERYLKVLGRALCIVFSRTKESCPRWSGTVRLSHWSFDDPEAVTESVGHGGKHSCKSVTRLLPPCGSSWPRVRHGHRASVTPVIKKATDSGLPHRDCSDQQRCTSYQQTAKKPFWHCRTLMACTLGKRGACPRRMLKTPPCKSAASEAVMRTLFGTGSFRAKRERRWRTLSASC